MKAIVQNGYGSSEVLKLKEVDIPVFGEKDVLVRIYAAALNAGDAFTMKGSPWVVRFMVGFPKPKDYILGWDLAGRVEEVGKAVTRFKPGDEVFTACTGTLAEYAIAGEDTVSLKPANLSFEQAAAVPTAALTALQALRDQGKLRSGEKVLINGASGGVGSFAVQIAKVLGAEVTGVCSTRNLEMVRSIGADKVIDYTKDDFTKGEDKFDLILDNVANRRLTDLKRALNPEGRIIPNSGHGGMGYVIKAYILGVFMRQLGSMFVANPNHGDLEFLKEHIESGKISPVIDRTYPIAESIEGLQYQAAGHVHGKIVITVAGNDREE